MAKALVDEFRAELADAIGFLIETSLIDDQQMPARRTRGSDVTVLEADYWATDPPRTQAPQPYRDLYDQILSSRSYDLRFLDGALTQIQYEFDGAGQVLRRARLAFLPSSDLTSYQEDPTLYEEETGYSFLDPRVVPVPLRFDFDSRPDVASDLSHPVSHLTIGQYPHCRIAASSAITPYYFIELILRSFYRSKSRLISDQLPAPRVGRMPSTITRLEQTLLHMSVPTT